MTQIDPVLAAKFSKELDEARYPPLSIRVVSNRDLGTITRLEELKTAEEKEAFLDAILRRRLGRLTREPDTNEPLPAHVLDEQRRLTDQLMKEIGVWKAIIQAAADGDPVEEMLLQDYKERHDSCLSDVIDQAHKRARVNKWWLEKKALDREQLFYWSYDRD